MLALPDRRTYRLAGDALRRAAQEVGPSREPGLASLRRFLVDEGFLSRRGGEYWRTGGPVEL